MPTFVIFEDGGTDGGYVSNGGSDYEAIGNRTSGETVGTNSGLAGEFFNGSSYTVYQSFHNFDLTAVDGEEVTAASLRFNVTLAQGGADIQARNLEYTRPLTTAEWATRAEFNAAPLVFEANIATDGTLTLPGNAALVTAVSAGGTLPLTFASEEYTTGVGPAATERAFWDSDSSADALRLVVEAPDSVGTFEISDSATVGWTGLAPATTPEGVFAVSDSTSAGFVGARTSAATFDVSDTTNVTWTGQSPAIPATFPVADNTDVTWVGTRTSVPGTFAVADDVTVAWTGLLPPTAESPNRLQNPSFETLLPAWGSGKHDTGAGSTGTFSRTDVPSAFSGDFVGQYAIDELAVGYELYVERIPFAPSYLSRGVYIPAEERGEQLTFSFYHRRSDANGQTPQARLDIFFYDSGGTQISSQTEAAEWDLTQTSWSRSSLAAISIPATAHYFGFRMYFRMTSSLGSYPAFTMLLDAFQVEFGATATPYQDTPVPTGTFATDVTDVVAWTGLSPAFSEYAVTDTVGVTWSGYRASAGTYEIDDIVTVPWFGQGPDVDRAVEVEVASRRELPWASGVLRRPVEVSGTTRSERTLDPVMRRAVPQSGTLRATHEVSVTTRAGREVGSTSRRRHDVAPARR